MFGKQLFILSNAAIRVAGALPFKKARLKSYEELVLLFFPFYEVVHRQTIQETIIPQKKVRKPILVQCSDTDCSTALALLTKKNELYSAVADLRLVCDFLLEAISEQLSSIFIHSYFLHFIHFALVDN